MKLQPTLLALVVAGAFGVTIVPASAQTEEVQPPRQSWTFDGPFGTFDQAQIQRGFKIYREVCSNCHSMDLLSFRNLEDPTGPGYSEAQVKQIASEYKIKDLDDKGNPIERPGRPADHFPSPFPNELAAKAAFGVAPPDMSTLAKARGYERGFPWWVFDVFTQYQQEGPDYIDAILQGYTNPPKGFKLPPGGHYNKYFPGHNIAMPQPLQPGQVKYDDGTPETLPQYAKDVASFLMWAAEPHLVERKRLGFQVMIFLIVFAGLLYFTKRKVWHEVEAPREVAHGQEPAQTAL